MKIKSDNKEPSEITAREDKEETMTSVKMITNDAQELLHRNARKPPIVEVDNDEVENNLVDKRNKII